MNEIKLSQDINVITAEINSYKQVAGQAIFEVGKRLKHVKENVEHGDWSDWCKSIGMSRGQATKFMTVYEDLKTNGSMSNQIGLEALYQIATLPQEEREKEHVTSKGETKTVDEMTVRELQEVKRKNKELEDSKKQAEKQAEQARQSEKIALKQLEELESKEPETIEVVPEDYDYIKGNYESAVSLQNRYKEQLEEMRSELENRQTNNNDDSELKELERKEKTLKNKISAYQKIYDMQTELDHVLNIIQPNMNNLKTNEIKNEHEFLSEFEMKLNEVMNVCNEMLDRLPNKNIIEGEIVDEI